MPSEDNRDQRKPGRWLMIVLFAAVLCAFTVSAGFVLARQQLLQRQTTQLGQTAALGPHVLVTQVSAGVCRRRSNFPPAFTDTSKIRSTRRSPDT